MFEPSKETRVLLATFMAVSAGAVAGCTEDADSDSLVSDDTSYTRLKDDSGKEYTLVKNGDGTETAKYDDGDSVTFKRDDDGSLNVVSGTAGLLAGLGAGYLMWYGLNSSGSHYDSTTRSYKPSTSVSQDIKKNGWAKYDKEKDKNGGTRGATGSAVTNSTKSSTPSSNSTKSNYTTSNSKPAVTSQTKSTTPSTKSSVSAGSTKSGFGGAGARSGGAAS